MLFAPPFLFIVTISERRREVYSFSKSICEECCFFSRRVLCWWQYLFEVNRLLEIFDAHERRFLLLFSTSKIVCSERFGKRPKISRCTDAAARRDKGIVFY